LRAPRQSAPDEELPQLVDAVANEQDRLRQALSAFCAEHPPNTLQDVDEAQTKALLARLKTLLMTEDTLANSLFSESEDALQAAFGEALETLREQIETFDYEAALATLEGLSAASDGRTTDGSE
jgi:hypothetical protein